MTRYRDPDRGGAGDGHATVLLANLGTPAAPTPGAVRRYLRQFLSDPRVVEKPRLLWWVVLNVFILPFAARRSARRYRSIWRDEGSPLLVLSERLRVNVERELSERDGPRFEVVLGMRYGRPSIGEALAGARRRGCSRLICVPLYPQYSSPTTGSVFDALAEEISTWRRVPDLRMVGDYHDEPDYIRALASSIRDHWTTHGEPDRLLVSLHGLPTRFVEAGDPYRIQCENSARLLTDALELEPERWRLAYQSRFGREPWIGPATDESVVEEARNGTRRLDVVCPGFAVDCIETIEEIGVEARALFEAAGGGELRAIPCLNDRDDHARLIADLVRRRVN